MLLHVSNLLKFNYSLVHPILLQAPMYTPKKNRWMCILCKQWPHDKSRLPCTTMLFGKQKQTPVTVHGYCDCEFLRDYWKGECDAADERYNHTKRMDQIEPCGCWEALDLMETTERKAAYNPIYQMMVKEHLIEALKDLGFVGWDLN